MKMRKLIALFSVVMMLCAIVPMGALTVSAAENLVPAYSSWTTSTDTATIAEEADGTLKISYISNYGWAGFYLKLEANTDYQMSFRMKGSKTSRKTSVSIKDSGWTATLHKADWTSADLMGTEWIERSFVFNTGSTTSFVFLIQSGHSSAWDAWLDDVVITKYTESGEPETPVEPENPYVPVEGNLVKNPSFETGDFTSWSKYDTTVITESIVHSGKYAIQTNRTSGEWDSMIKQTSVAVTANTDYILSYWYYYDGTDTTASFYASANDSAGFIGSTHVKNITPNTWAQVTVEFNSASNTSVTVYAKNGTANSTGTFYFDDFVLLQVGSTEPEQPETPDTPVDPVIPTGNLVSNSTFETGNYSGWTVYNGTAVSNAKPKTGSYSLLCKGLNWNGIAETKIATEVGKSYQLTFWYYIETAGFNWKVTGATTETKYVGTWENTNLGSWQQITTEFIADDTQVIFTVLGLNGSSSPVFYIDDVFVVEVKGPSNDGFIINGDFEVGKTTGWTVHQSTVVSADAANNSSYGVNLKGNGGWGGMLNQSFKTKKGLKYVLTLDLKVNNYGTNMQVRNVADDANLASRWFDSKCNTWTTYTFEFTAVSTDTYLNFCGGGGGSSTGGEDVYVDNISIVEIPCEHQWDSIQDDECNICGETREVGLVDIVVSGQTSAAEDVNGVAFKFEISASNVGIDNNNKYMAGSATIDPFGNGDAYTLIAMGAVVSNTANNSTEKMLNLNTVNGKSVIKIEATYLLGAANGALSFATRIVNIPEGKEDTVLYARAYYVFEKDGQTIVVYDDIVTGSYSQVFGG